jgi:hypothetical protein
MSTIESAGELVRFGKLRRTDLLDVGRASLKSHPFERNLNPRSELVWAVFRYYR